MIKLQTSYSVVPVVHVGGRVEGEDANQLKSTLMDLADYGYDTVAVELSEVSGIDSTGIGALIAARARFTQLGGSICLANCSGPLVDDLRNTGLTDLFACYDRLEDVPEPS